MRNIRVGALLGIPILVNPSWFVILAFTTAILATDIYPGIVGGLSTATYVAMALASVFVFFGSIVVHELAHSLVARAYDIPVKSITLFIFGGVAHITREARRPLAELLMAAAGPATSLGIGLLFLGLWAALGTNSHRPIDQVIVWLGVTNIALAVFNLIPAFPTDGGRIFRSLIWLLTGNYFRATAIAAWTGRVAAWLMMAVGVLAALRLDVAVADSPVGGFWLILIGLFLENAARQSLFQNRVVRELQRYRAGDLMYANPPVVDASMTVAALSRGVLDINPRVCYFVENDGRLAGIVSAHQLRAVPEAAWDSTTAAQAMVPSDRLHAVPPERPAAEVLREMEHGDLTHLPVVREGQVIGVIGRDRILGVLRQAGFLKSAPA
ncbi:MAG: site-2 protease family protein [Dehalococcoidia bacterium]|nr:site-2 protease family protein [Dehalococcoidia bacterium]